MEKLIGAKSLEKAMEVQSEYLRSSYEGLVAEATKLGELYADLAKEAYKPFESVLMKMPGDEVTRPFSALPSVASALICSSNATYLPVAFRTSCRRPVAPR